MQTLPVIAVGDYNFDCNVDDGEGNQGFKNMTTPDIWKWVRPGRLYKTQASKSYNGVLDFIFIANQPGGWEIDSRILVNGFPSKDDGYTSDHRPLEARVFVD